VNGSKRHKALALLLGVALSLAAIGNTVAVEPTTNETVVTGHTNWVDPSSTYNSCFAGIAGLLKNEVTWFNGQTLFSTDAGGAGTFIYFTESLQADDGEYNESTGLKVKDPTQEKLVKTDNEYEVEDPSGADHTWVVREYFTTREKKGAEAGVGETDVDSGEARQVEKVYVYVVQVHAPPIEDDRESVDKRYNFLGLVDTCKFNQDGEQKEHANDGTYGTEPSGQHNDDGTGSDESDQGTHHNHTAVGVDIWIGGVPDTLPGNDEQGVPDEGGSQDQDADGSDDGGDGS